MIKREKYLSDIRGFYDSDLIKIITGIRRSGKSVLLSDIKSEICVKSDNVISLDFEDISNIEAVPDCNSLLKYVDEQRKEGLCYVFLDEIQRMDGWADACRTLRLRNCSVFISGSNSKLLSGEFTKELSGRYVSFRVRPFVYKEIKEYAHELQKDISIMDYLIWGGFPKRLEFDTQDQQRTYLNELNETIILNDIITRYQIRKKELFERLANYIFISNARVFSVRSIAAYIKSNGLPCSVTTVAKYIGFLEEAFAVDSVKLFSRKAKRELGYYQKLYNADVSLNSIRVMGNRYDLTHNFENIIYNELLYRDYELQVFNDGKGEIDFIAIKNGKKFYIQAALSIAEEKTYNREFAPFNRLDNLSQKIIITNDAIDYSTSTVRHIKFSDFVMMDEL